MGGRYSNTLKEKHARICSQNMVIFHKNVKTDVSRLYSNAIIRVHNSNESNEPYKIICAEVNKRSVVAISTEASKTIWCGPGAKVPPVALQPW